MTNCRFWTLPRIRLRSVLCAAAMGFAALGFTALRAFPSSAQSGPASGSGAASAPAGPIIPVTITKATHQDVPMWLKGLGSVQPFQSVQVRTRVDGTLLDVPVAEGQEVKKGDLLAIIDPRPYRALLDVAMARKKQDQAALENAKADLTRYTALAQKEIASRQKLDAVTMQVNQLNAAIAADDALIASAELNLAFSYITAPFDARVGLRSVDPGNVVRAAEATPMFSLVQIHPIAATFTVPQDHLPEIQQAMALGPLPVVAFGSDDRTELAQGTLLTIDNAIDPATGTIRLKATFPNQDNRLWPGQFINVRMLLHVDRNALTVPSAAVLRGPIGEYVYVVKPDSTVARQVIEVNRDDGKVAIVTKGLEAGQTVVQDGQSRLRVGSRVAAAEPNRANGTPTPKTGG